MERRENIEAPTRLKSSQIPQIRIQLSAQEGNLPENLWIIGLHKVGQKVITIDGEVSIPLQHIRIGSDSTNDLMEHGKNGLKQQQKKKAFQNQPQAKQCRTSRRPPFRRTCRVESFRVPSRRDCPRWCTSCDDHVFCSTWTSTTTMVLPVMLAERVYPATSHPHRFPPVCCCGHCYRFA